MFLKLGIEALMYKHELCVGCFTCYCDKIPNRSNLTGEADFGEWFQGFHTMLGKTYKSLGWWMWLCLCWFSWEVTRHIMTVKNRWKMDITLKVLFLVASTWTPGPMTQQITAALDTQKIKYMHLSSMENMFQMAASLFFHFVNFY